jgi:hypothetical protein
MGKPIRVPDPVYSKATSEAERQDVSRGAIIRDWMEKAEKYDEMEVRHR